MSQPCRFANRPEVMTDAACREIPAERMLCAWAHFHPAAPAKLVDTPPWLSRAALAGHLMRAEDCDRCPHHEPGPPVEGPH